MANLQEPWQIAGFASTPRRWRPYPAYKPSGVDWLGAIPAHWDVKRLKYVAPICDERAYAVEPEARYIALEHIESATGRLGESASEGSQKGAAAEGTAAVFRAGDVLFGKLRPYLSKVLEASFDGVCSTELLVMRPTPEITSRFLAYTLLSKEFITWVDSMTYGTKMPRASPEQVTNTEAPLPPVTEQCAIAAFLDRETAKIDALVAKKERLIELLQEKRVALITHAVTKGLDSSAAMKSSGVEWLGQIPAHWEVKRLRYLGEGIIGLTYEPSDLVGPDDGGVLVLRVSNVSDGHIVLEDNVFVKRAMPDRLRTRLGDILICSRSGSRALVGKSAKIGEAAVGLTFGTFMTIFRSVCNNYLFCAFNSTLFEYQSGAFLTSTINQLTVSNLKSLTVPMPPDNERSAIAAFLDVETAKIDALIAKVRDAIERFKELRTTLISAAVTAKIDVREAVESEKLAG